MDPPEVFVQGEHKQPAAAGAHSDLNWQTT